MSKRGNKRDEDETLSQNEEPPRKNPKTAAAGSVSDDSDHIHICDLSNNRKVSVRNWQGKIVVDIREFYVKDGKEFPGKKGISLGIDQWNILRDHVDEIDNEVGGKA
ncbi:RNA polymerase II transcriptional coactivator KIWI-like [Primulina huaijiensis]|uniref:RNA polymerase II transcriptional coactivator KIWI-like n=1 Tax=Primulina huaijiensis TaxID=1492673 RepID=UPI003CC75EDB